MIQDKEESPELSRDQSFMEPDNLTSISKRK